tara:strand:+ start:348 stop:617 length:270 start_codon:yes stop_codon:yes gene_type:complete
LAPAELLKHQPEREMTAQTRTPNLEILLQSAAEAVVTLGDFPEEAVDLAAAREDITQLRPQFQAAVKQAVKVTSVVTQSQTVVLLEEAV